MPTQKFHKQLMIIRVPPPEKKRIMPPLLLNSDLEGTILAPGH